MNLNLGDDEEVTYVTVEGVAKILNVSVVTVRKLTQKKKLNIHHKAANTRAYYALDTVLQYKAQKEAAQDELNMMIPIEEAIKVLNIDNYSILYLISTGAFKSIRRTGRGNRKIYLNKDEIEAYKKHLHELDTQYITIDKISKMTNLTHRQILCTINNKNIPITRHGKGNKIHIEKKFFDEYFASSSVPADYVPTAEAISITGLTYHQIRDGIKKGKISSYKGEVGNKKNLLHVHKQEVIDYAQTKRQMHDLPLLSEGERS